MALDFEGRAVVLAGTLDVGTGSATIVAGSFEVEPTGQVQGQGTAMAPGGSFSVDTTGDIRIQSTRLGGAFAFSGPTAGFLSLISTGGSIAAASLFQFASTTLAGDGGSVVLEADLDVLLDGRVTVQGGINAGLGGDVDITAGRDVRVVDLEMSGGDAGGGSLIVFAGENVTLGAVRGIGTQFLPSGPGGSILVDANGSVVVNGPIDLRGSANTSFGGDGGSFDVTAGGAGGAQQLDLAGPILVGGRGPDGCGGLLSALAPEIMVPAGITLDGGGDCGGTVDLLAADALLIQGRIDVESSDAGPGSVSLLSGGSLDMEGVIDADGGGLEGGDGGGVVLDADGALRINGSVTANARNASSFGGVVTLSGCDVRTLPSAVLEATGSDGTIEARIGRVSFLPGFFTAGAGITLRYRDPAVPPDLAGAVMSPVPAIVPDATLPPCACISTVDADTDGIADACDNCILAINPGQQDLDADGTGSACSCDFDGDGSCTAGDFAVWRNDYLLGVDGGTGTDMDTDGLISLLDYRLFVRGLAQGAPGPAAIDP